ncbi:hypothetical protein PHYC_01880 [Phycisphaerales bacterium]|nr:hypothetical protein PHYC_01880 [Phycisphaerales bacterium]
MVPIWLAAEMVAWLPRDALGFTHVTAAITSLMVLALFRELGRAWMLRLQGADPDSVVVWPLGGVAPTPSSPTPRPLLSEMGGLLTNALLVPVLGALVLWSGAGWDALLHFEPFSPRITAGGLRSYPQVWAWWAYYGNGMLLLANALLPMSPMDAGRMSQTWARRGRDGSESSILRLGVFTGVLLFVVGAASSESRVLALGAFGALATYFDFRRAEFVKTPIRTERTPEPSVQSAEEEDLIPSATVSHPGEPPAPPPPSLDGVLEKISREGMESLNEDERLVLRRETERRRRR